MKNMFKLASLLAAAVMLFACEKEDPTGDIMIISDKDVIQSNGSDVATLKVMVGDKDVTADAVIYDENNNELSLADGKFTADKDGEYKFWATYGTLTTYNKSVAGNNLFVIKAISVAVPDPASDTKPENTSFVHRAFLTQYTGTGCGYCPYMMQQLFALKDDGTIPSKAVHAASHSGYNTSDPAKISAPPSPDNYPYLTVDLSQGYSHSAGIKTLRSLIDNSASTTAKAGLSVNPVYYEKERLRVVIVAVKAAEAGIFNVGAWLLEDNIYGQQSDYDGIKRQDPDHDYDTHNNCLRVADSYFKGTYFGHYLGEMMSGDVLYKTFVMNVKKDWKKENLHLAVFASSGVKEGSTLKYTVCNAVDAPIDAPTPFEYK